MQLFYRYFRWKIVKIDYKKEQNNEEKIDSLALNTADDHITDFGHITFFGQTWPSRNSKKPKGRNINIPFDLGRWEAYNLTPVTLNSSMMSMCFIKSDMFWT